MPPGALRERVVAGGFVLPGWEQDSCKWRGIGGKKGSEKAQMLTRNPFSLMQVEVKTPQPSCPS